MSKRWLPEYRIWNTMKSRCHGSGKGRGYKDRGITVCDRWRASFEDFLADMGPRPSPDHSIDRYPNNDGNYEPDNCRWATRRQQTLNSRICLKATGVSRTKTGAWAAQICVHKKVMHLGDFREREQAEAAYRRAVEKYAEVA